MKIIPFFHSKVEEEKDLTENKVINQVRHLEIY